MFALLPLITFIVIYLGISILMGDFYKVPVTVAFLISSIVAVLTLKGRSMGERMKIFTRGAGQENVMLMLWIYVLAGAFAASAKAIGSIDATVNMTLHMLPPQMIMAGLFLAACFISLSIGTSVGTVVALVPLAADISAKTTLASSGMALSQDVMLPLTTAIVVGGAYFGDNLSFISDTTVAATKSQGCRMNDKFKANFRIVMPAAIVVLIAYIILGLGANVTSEIPDYNLLLVFPYLLVLLLAVCGMDVMIVLTLGCVATGIVGLINGAYDVFGWMHAMGDGIIGMGELIIVAMLAAGMLEAIRVNGGIDFIINSILKKVNGKKGAEGAIALLVTLVNICTANNTVAIITVGGICRNIAERFDISPRRAASLLDTFSCFTQGLLPYGVQLLLAGGLAGIASTAIIPYLFYPFAIGIAATCSILMKVKR